VEVMKIDFAMVALGFFVKRILLVMSTVEKMKNNPGTLVSFTAVNEVNEIFIYMIAFALYLQILQLLWVIGFTRDIAVFESTLKHTKGPLASFSIIFMIIFIGFLAWSYLLFSNAIYDYRDILHASYQQSCAMLNNFDVVSLIDAAGISGKVVFFLYESIMNFIFLNMLVTVLMDIHADVASGALETGTDHELVDELMERFKSKKKEKKKVRKPEDVNIEFCDENTTSGDGGNGQDNAADEDDHLDELSIIDIMEDIRSQLDSDESHQRPGKSVTFNEDAD